MKLKRIAASHKYPVSLQTAKNYMRIIHNEDDGIIDILLAAACDKAEQITNRQLTPATFELYADASGNVYLPKPPLATVTSVEVLKDGVYVSADYTLDDKQEPAKLTINDIVSGTNSVKILYDAGYKICPDAIKQWILIYVSTMYEQREIFRDGSSTFEPKKYVDHLLDSYRVRIV